ncbi:MAG: N-acetylglucosamine-6-phosphate deacetylase [Verrucomicrobiales bacterium]|nr:N-acetylglucosamine-6-phosphate deacetylase [Verrucomicrobiales bacterium]
MFGFWILVFLASPPLVNNRGVNEGEISAWHYASRKPVRVRWQNGIISHLDKAETQPSRDLWIAPSLFDNQVNGYGGIDFQQDNVTEADLLSAVRQMRRDGCAEFFLTLITDEWSKLTARFQYLKRLRDSSAPEIKNAIVGWHIEGPFLSDKPGFHGAHNPAFMCDPAPEKIREFKTIAGDDPLLLTIAPERNGAIDAIALCTSLGIEVSLGHTNAPLEILRRAVEAGAKAFTHLGNGCPRELDRHDNILWRIFETPGISASLIPDQIHVSPELFRLIHRVINPKNIFYTTDAMSAGGAPPGIYKLQKYELEVGADQIVRQPGKTNFAGSALRPIDGIFRAAKMLERPWQEVWPRFSTQPLKLMGLRHDFKVGQPANFCVLRFSETNELAELRTWSRGLQT